MIVEYCPTEDMISDVLTKPLQGSAFCKLRALLHNKRRCVSVLEPNATGSRGSGETWHDDVTVRASGSRRSGSNAVRCR
jgi:hypothetical protein